MNQASLLNYLSSHVSCEDATDHFKLRLATNLTLIKELYFSIYPENTHSKDFFQLINQLETLFKKRPKQLKDLDLQRIQQQNWYQSEKMVGMQLYVDHFNGDLKGLIDKISYFEELGINFLHLMPITTRPKGENDGGYAVKDYTKIDSKYGTQKDLKELTALMRSKGMYLMLDFVVNHTSDEHIWAKKAKEGNSKYQGFYYTYADRHMPDAFESSLPEVFPETAPGNFSYIPEMEKWVMTVFNTYQWDLNYTNPKVFVEMLGNLVALSNQGVDMVRFDALAFLWKKIGTNSQNLDEAHRIISLFRLCLQVVAPGTILLAEAIVAPDEILNYFGQGIRKGNECEVAYNASLMALLWNSIATKKTTLLYKTIFNTSLKPKECTWVNYIRCHDDIGLGLDDRFISELGWNPQGHRKFLLDYYCQRLDWSPAMGILFMYNPKTGDGRITGSAASLLGLEAALESKDKEAVAMAIQKIMMMHGIILSYGGIPMIYGGDEIGALNDYAYLSDPDKSDDSRWVNRPHYDWKVIEKIADENSIASELFYRIKKLIKIRKATPAFADSDNNNQLHYTNNEHILMFERFGSDGNNVLVLANFDEMPQVVASGQLTALGYIKNQEYFDKITGEKAKLNSGFLELMPYQMLWLAQAN